MPLSHDARGHAHRDAAGGQIRGHDGPGAHHAAIADSDSAQYLHAGTEPDVTADARWQQDVRMVADGLTERRPRMIGGKDAAMHRDEGMVPNLHSSMAVHDRVRPE